MRAAIVSMLVFLGGCEPVVRAQATVCADVAWGGWGGSARCRVLAERTIPGVDRGCTTDADCVLVHAGASCREQSVVSSAAARYEALDPSCVNPASGPCGPRVARCIAGCCTAAH